MRLTLDPTLEEHVLAAWLTMDGLSHDEQPEFRNSIDSECSRMVDLYAGSKPSEIPALAAARRLYKSVGMEPTRHRPSSEALLRRVLQGKGLYRLDPIVDTGNLFSLKHSLPLGLYDRARIHGDVNLRLGAEGESFEGIRKGPVNVAARLCLADEEGAFGSPSSDSDRCRIRPETESILALLYAPADYDPRELREKAQLLSEEFSRWNGARPMAGGLLGKAALS